MAFNGTTLVLSDGPDADQNIYSYDPGDRSDDAIVHHRSAGWFSDRWHDVSLNAPYAEILGQKWDDIDGDGVRDPGEPGLNNWVIELYDDQKCPDWHPDDRRH